MFAMDTFIKFDEIMSQCIVPTASLKCSLVHEGRAVQGDQGVAGAVPHEAAGEAA